MCAKMYQPRGSAPSHGHRARAPPTSLHLKCRPQPFHARTIMQTRTVCRTTTTDQAKTTQITKAFMPAPFDAADLQDYKHPVEPEQFRAMGYRVVDWVADYFKGLQDDGQKHVTADVQPGYLAPLLPRSPPEAPETFDAVFADFQRTLLPGVAHWQSPRFFAWFPANASLPGLLADMLGGALNMIGFSWAASPVSTELEQVMMDWLAQLMGLPERFHFSSGGPGGGVIQGTSSEAVLVAMLAARARAMRGQPPAHALNLVAYSSDQAHSCFRKAAMVAGVTHVRLVPARAENDWALQVSDLEAAMAADVAAGLTPFFVMGSIGTTSSCAVDPVAAISAAAVRAGGSPHGPAWVHVDAAYAGAAAVCPELRAAHFGGLEAVDSYSFNPHKWLLTNFDCCAMWAADTGPIKEALSLTPVFLQGKGNALDYKDWQVPLGRRFRSLKLFFVLRMYGAEGLRRYVRHHAALASHFASLVNSDARFELAAPPRFGLVCFRLAGVPRAVNEALLAAVNGSRSAFLVHTELGGVYTLRLAIGSTGTQLSHIEEVWGIIQAEATRVLTDQNAHQKQ